MLILGIETSCDETSLALLDNEVPLAMHTFSQADIHAVFGGVVPEVASRNHLMKIIPLFEKVMATAEKKLEEIDMIAVTNAPGLIGALFVGVSFAKGLGYGLNIPVVPVHHLAGHILSAELSGKGLRPPYLSMVVSGGHTHIYEVTGQPPHFSLLGRTVDDAAGEAFDKVAKMLGGPYPGGPFVEKLAKEGKPEAIAFPVAMKGKPDFSFSGLKTAVLTKINEGGFNSADIAASFQYTAAKTLALKLLMIAAQTGRDTIVVTGGVAVNETVRSIISREAGQNGLTVFYPNKKLCNDNAAMIAYAAWRMHAHDSHNFMDLSFAAGDTKHNI